MRLQAQQTYMLLLSAHLHGSEGAHSVLSVHMFSFVCQSFWPAHRRSTFYSTIPVPFTLLVTFIE